jgi:hypothetical protein
VGDGDTRGAFVEKVTNSTHAQVASNTAASTRAMGMEVVRHASYIPRVLIL